MGTVAFILNYVPILGPAAAAIFIFLFAGTLAIASTWQALLPAAHYGAIHVIEGETVTPMFSRQAIHTQSGSRGLLFRVLVLTVGRPWRDPLGRDSGHNQNRVRSHSSAGGFRPPSLGAEGVSAAASYGVIDGSPAPPDARSARRARAGSDFDPVLFIIEAR
jgi:hypothetical protein